MKKWTHREDPSIFFLSPQSDLIFPDSPSSRKYWIEGPTYEYNTKLPLKPHTTYFDVIYSTYPVKIIRIIQTFEPSDKNQLMIPKWYVTGFIGNTRYEPGMDEIFTGVYLKRI
jgi:hypothetical protein